MNISNWFNTNGMMSNPDKFQVIIFGNHNNELDHLNIEGHIIKCQSVVKHLGVKIDQKMDFSCHIDQICKRTGKQVNAIYRLCNVLDVETKEVIYNSFIKANFDYCPLIWAFCNKGDLQKLQKLQNRAIRFVYGDYDCESVDLITKYNMKSILQCNIYEIAVEMFKCFNDVAPSYISALFKKQNNGYRTRNFNNFVLRCPRTVKYGQKCLSYIGARIWNNLPVSLKTVDDLSHFKSMVFNVNFDLNDLDEVLYGKERVM